MANNAELSTQRKRESLQRDRRKELPLGRLVRS
jgi:hypothetical protein